MIGYNHYKIINIDYIIVAKEYHYKMSSDVCDYHVKREIKKNNRENDYCITDKISGWTSDLTELSKSWIRDKKIDQIFNKDILNTDRLNCR